MERFETEYRELIDRTRANTNAKIILVEPFVLPVSEDRHAWREDLDPKIHIIRRLAREYDTAYVPLDGLFTQASMKAPCAYWAADGVHPSPAGHGLIARAWLETVGALQRL